MVALINLGDNSIPTDNLLGDVIMPDRDIDTLFDNRKPDEPEEQPEDIAQPEFHWLESMKGTKTKS